MAYTQSTSREDRGHDQDSIELVTVMEPSPDTAVCETENSTDDADPEPSTARLVLVLLGLWVSSFCTRHDEQKIYPLIMNLVSSGWGLAQCVR